MCVCPHRNPERTSKAKVCQLEIVPFVDKEILWFKIAMEDAMRMTVKKTSV